MTGMRAVGVDFGTSSSLVAEGSRNQRARVTPIGRARASMPTVAHWDGRSLTVGEEADVPGDGVVLSVKTAIGERRHALVDAAGHPLPIDADSVMVAVLKEVASRAYGRGVDLSAADAIRLGCPAMWDGDQRRRLLHVAAEAGIDVGAASLIDEPIAAGVAWAAERSLRHAEYIDGRLLVFDMGGGTLDIALLDVEAEPGSVPSIRVLSALGAPLAGDVVDAALARDLEERLGSQGMHVDELPRPGLVRGLLRRAGRTLKESLSDVHDATAVLPYPDVTLPTLRYSREELDEAFRPTMKLAEEYLLAALRAARLTHKRDEARPLSTSALRALTAGDLARDVDYVLLAGGMSVVPHVGRHLSALLPRARVYESSGHPADHAVAAGLADVTGYERINLHRPGFNIQLDWESGGRRGSTTLYRAHTPFYEPYQAMSSQSVAYTWRDDPRRPQLPSAGVGVLRVTSMSGEEVRMNITQSVTERPGEGVAGLRVAFGNAQTSLYLTPNGLMKIQDGTGRESHFRLPRWPVIRGRRSDTLTLEPIGALGHSTVGQLPWHLQPYD